MIKKMSLMVWIIIILISSSLALAAENVDVKLTAPASVQLGSPFNIDVSLNSKGQNVKAITLYVTSENGKINFLSSAHSGEVWFSGKDPTQNNAVTLGGKGAWLFNIGPFGSTGESSAADKTVFSLTATASGDDKVIIYNLNTDSKVSKLGIGSLTINAVTPATITVTAAPLACTSADWEVTWGSCSAVCGGGTQTSIVTKKAGSTCTTEGGKPAVSTQGCNTQACPPTASCTDGIQNQAETGVDCGGPCAACAPASLKVETTNQETYNLLTAIRDGLDTLSNDANTLQKISAIASALKTYFG